MQTFKQFIQVNSDRLTIDELNSFIDQTVYSLSVIAATMADKILETHDGHDPETCQVLQGVRDSFVDDMTISFRSDMKKALKPVLEKHGIDPEKRELTHNEQVLQEILAENGLKMP